LPQITRRLVLAALPAVACGHHVVAHGSPDRSAVLTVGGLVRPGSGEREVRFDLAALAQLPQRRIKTRTPWHSGEQEFTGPLLRDLLAAAGTEGQTLRMWALNDYRVDIPFDDARRFDVIVAHQINGQPISVRDKGPLFVMYPFDRNPELRNSVYLSRCIWQLRRIESR
jgi:hypothetical protein